MLALLQTAFESTPATLASAWRGSGGIGWEWYAFTAVLISLFATTVAYMLAIALQSDGLKKWAKAEFVEVLASIIIVALLLVIVSAAVSSTSALSRHMASTYGYESAVQLIGLSPSSPFDVAYAMISKRVECEKSHYVFMVNSNAFVELFEKTSIGMVWGEPVSGWPVSFLSNQFHSFANSLVYILIGEYLIWHLLWFFEHSMFTFFLPLGIILRTFPLTRGAGAFLMALSIGLFLILPTVFTIEITFYLSGIPQGAYVGCSLQPTSSSIDNLIKERCYSGEASSLGAQAYDYLKNKKDSIAHAERVQGDITRLSFVPFFFLLAGIITMTAVRALAQLFGTDTQELSRGMIKLL